MLSQHVDNSSRFWLQAELQRFAGSIPPGSRVLDAGSGGGLYAGLFSHCTYEAADFLQVNKKYAFQTYICDLTAIPTENARFDCVVFTQVMEHLPKPESVLTELHRVLKPGGKLFFSAPLYYEEHGRWWLSPIFYLVRPIFGFAARICRDLDCEGRLTDRGHPKNYFAVFEKPL